MTRHVRTVLCLFALLAIATAVSADEGKEVYEKTCATCHDGGVAGAPKLGDEAAWSERLGKGMDTLVANAINGYQGESGNMPAKGGNPALSDEQVEAAVEYMVDESR